MAIYKYFAGLPFYRFTVLPFYRQSSIQKHLGVNLTASTVFGQVESVCDAIYPSTSFCSHWRRMQSIIIWMTPPTAYSMLGR
jgi:hypothetical protein